MAVLACNAGRLAQTAAPSAEGEMSLAETMEVPANDGRPEVLHLLGVPDAFTLKWQELEGRPIRWEEWLCFDSAAGFDFVDGEPAWTACIEPEPDGALYTHAYSPLDFDSSMT